VVTETPDLHSVFESEAQEAFSFLEGYGFELADVTRFGDSLTELTYAGPPGAVVVRLERDSSVIIGIVERTAGRLPEVPSAQMVGLNEIMVRRDGKTAPAIVDRQLVREDLPELLRDSAAAVRAYVEPFLSGDATFVEKIRAARHDR
jgi:hypothetical protein